VLPELLATGEEEEEIGWIVDMLLNGISPKPVSHPASIDEESH